MKYILSTIILWIAPFLIKAEYSVSRLEPPCWWTGMKNTGLQLLVYGPGISQLIPAIDYPGVSIHEVISVDSPNYLFISLNIDENTQPGEFSILFSEGRKTVIRHPYRLYAREEGSAQRQGFSPRDVIYLVTPDRFANGDPSNDNVSGYLETADRSKSGGRHGGDLAGIISRLDYISEMGFTSLWLNPVLENNMPRTSYHGYAITDYYRIDPRYGSNEQYRELSLKAREKGIGLIMDMVENHCGAEHWWMKDLPAGDWINHRGKFKGTNHRRTTVQDPYAAPSEKDLFHDGWFVPDMPDLNQKNPLLATYLIQNTIWWIEFAGLSGIRQDTYSYPDKDFMARWSCAVMEEYPAFSIVGEEWSLNPSIVSYWQEGKVNPDGYSSCLGSLMDFPLQAALRQGLTEDDAIYTDGLIRMYETLANDFLYADPSKLVIFADNHDMSRFYSQVGEDPALFRMGMAYILTMRGTPQVYYGSEVLMTSPGPRDDGVIRSDFPGGWQGDTVNAFTGEGLTKDQLENMLFLKKMLNWRKNSACIHSGSLMHFNPENGTYVYFRYNESETVMVVINKNREDVYLETGRFAGVIGDRKEARDVISGSRFPLALQLQVPARNVLILELR